MKISEEKKFKIFEQILAYLFSISPKLVFTVEVAKELARDEEFVKRLLLDLKKRGLVSEVKKSPKGKDYLKRSRWKMTEDAYLAYKKRYDTFQNI